MYWTEPERIRYVIEASVWCLGVMCALWALTRMLPRVASAIQRPSVGLVAILLLGTLPQYHGPAPLELLIPLALYPLVSPASGGHYASRFLVLAWAVMSALEHVAQFRWWRYGQQMPEWGWTLWWAFVWVFIPGVALRIKLQALRQSDTPSELPVTTLHLRNDGA